MPIPDDNGYIYDKDGNRIKYRGQKNIDEIMAEAQSSSKKDK